MTQNTQTTGDRIMQLIETRFPDKAAVAIAAEIDRLTAERDAARADVERLRPAAEAWEAREQYLNYELFGATAEYRDAALRECHRKDVLARAAKVTP